MRPRLRHRLSVLIAAAAFATLIWAASAAAADHDLIIGFHVRASADPALNSDAMGEVADLRAGSVRFVVSWAGTAPKSPGPDFDPADPADPRYDWAGLDDAVRAARARGLRVTLLVTRAPDWAESSKRPPPPCPDAGPCENNPRVCPVVGPPCAAPGTWKPNPRELAQFATAIARRYSGNFAGLPRVRDFQLWSEPNQGVNLSPQWTGKKPAAPQHYARMLRHFYAAVHGVSSSNRVIAGGTAPYGADRGVYNLRPLLFWRKLLCVKGRDTYRKVKCPVKPRFDVLAHHPINTSGGPRRGAINRDDISTPDLHRLVAALRGAERLGTARPRGRHPVRATELWWESNPPDPAEENPSLARQAKWYAAAFYLLWRQGASEVVLLQVRDAPYDGNPGRLSGSYQTGVLFEDGTEKPAADVIRFPFVADRRAGNKVVLWGKSPAGGRLVIEGRRGNGGFRRIKAFKVKSGAVFTKRLRLKGARTLRAKVAGQRSPRWRLKG